jgi:hypothetical protein
MATINTVRKNSDEANDLYRTEPLATEAAVMHGVFSNINTAWDCCDGLGGISGVLERHGISVGKSDIVNYGRRNVVVQDFLELQEPLFNTDCIVMNPPFKLTAEFLDKACNLSDKVIMFNRVSFLETVQRANKIKSGQWPLTDVYFHAYRVGCAKGMYETRYANAVFYAWFLFDKHRFTGKPVMHWITEGKR